MVAQIWSIAHLTKRAALLINLSVALYLTNCTIFSRLRSTFAIGFGLGFRVVLKLGFGLGLRNWPNVQRI